MMNVNFFEKKKINILLYIVSGAFLVTLLFIGIYFFLTRSHYENTIEENNRWLNENTESFVMSRQISRLDDLAIQSATVQENLRQNQYPMHEIATDLANTIPDESNQIVSLHIIDPNQVTLIMDNTPSTVAQSIVVDLEEKPYVENVQFLYVDSLNLEDIPTRFEMIVNINADLLIEEASE